MFRQVQHRLQRMVGTRSGGKAPAPPAGAANSAAAKPKPQKKAKLAHGDGDAKEPAKPVAAEPSASAAAPVPNAPAAAPMPSAPATAPVPAAEAAGEPSGSVPTKASVKKVAVGDSLPLELELENENGETCKLGDLVKERGCVFFMYPKANTPGCTKQACGFNDNLTPITAAGYDVYGLSADKPKSQLNWKTKYGLGYHLLCDPQHTLIKAFGAHKAPGSIARSHVVVEKGGKVLLIANQVSPGDSVAQASEFVLKQASKS
ncbi:Peroxiredoxin [Porphyridium purpureum]|uniref:thioredoxin-dependent peroxiredoxin n=1 Tax=Porphyridium purpureum TaxID=35688 RepID=A0A5J4ZA52_PORPP|nr:Peroxiredoxin [Porphyridium purpureum]|eukprot:POR8137..scf295_1